jgi:hypothetical protein
MLDPKVVETECAGLALLFSFLFLNKGVKDKSLVPYLFT